MFSGTELQRLLNWLEKHVTWNTQTINIRGGDGGTAPFSVFAVRDIAEGDSLCVIPKTAVLSTKNTEIADLIEEEQLGGGLALVLAIMYEHSIGVKSKW